jgi:hypothetical protein
LDRIRSWLGDLANNVLATVLTSGVVAERIGQFVKNAGWSTQEAVWTSIATFVGLVVVWGQCLQIYERGKRRRVRAQRQAKRARLANPSPEDLETQIRDWLWPYQFSVVHREPTEDLAFVLHVDDARKVSVTIAKHRRARWVTIICAMDFDEKERPAVRERAPFFYFDLAAELLRQGLQYSIEKHGDDVAQVKVHLDLPVSPSTTDLDLLNAILAVRTGVIAAANMHHRILAQPKAISPERSLARIPRPEASVRCPL